MRSIGLTSAFALTVTLGTAACDGAALLDPTSPPVDLTTTTSRQVLPPLVYVDGVRLPLATLSQMDRSRIERIEIIKGPAAVARYGEAAGAGVIHIFLKP